MGGAINIDAGIENSIFNNTHFIDNSAKTGGAIGITYKNSYIKSLTFENTEFIHNTAFKILTFLVQKSIIIENTERQVDKMMKRNYLVKSATVLSVCK